MFSIFGIIVLSFIALIAYFGYKKGTVYVIAVAVVCVSTWLVLRNCKRIFTPEVPAIRHIFRR